MHVFIDFVALTERYINVILILSKDKVILCKGVDLMKRNFKTLRMVALALALTVLAVSALTIPSVTASADGGRDAVQRGEDAGTRCP